MTGQVMRDLLEPERRARRSSACDAVRTRVFLLLCCLAALAPSTDARAQTSIARTVHNLTPTGPGTVKGTQAAGLCVYCHTPHRANPTAGLWNRDTSGVTYQIYASRTLQATVNQPTNSSRLCLSCHDGILALGSIRV